MALAQLPTGVSDQLTVTNQQNPGGAFVFSPPISENFELPGNITVFFQEIITTVPGFPQFNSNTLEGTQITDRLNANAGLWVLTEPGALSGPVDVTVQPGQTAEVILENLQLTPQQIGDIVGIITNRTQSIQLAIDDTPVTATQTTIEFGGIFDSDTAAVNLLAAAGQVLHFVPEPSNASFLTIDVSAAFNAGTPAGYTATFTSDSEGTGTTVPDAGATASLLSVGLAALAFLRRKLA
jgi:hypothetical protein